MDEDDNFAELVVLDGMRSGQEDGFLLSSSFCKKVGESEDEFEGEVEMLKVSYLSISTAKMVALVTED